MFYKIIDQRLRSPDLDMPCMAPGSAEANSVDLRACIRTPYNLHPGEQVMVSTGIKVALPKLTKGEITPRSGKGTDGLVIGNLTGNIDPDYRGEVFVCLWNRNSIASKKNIIIKPMQRIAQFVVIPILDPNAWVEVEELDTTERGDGGYGSTGDK